MADRNAELRAELQAARVAGDISLSEYLEELKNLRDTRAPGASSMASSSGAAASSSAAFAPAASERAQEPAIPAAYGDSSEEEDELVDEDGRPWKKPRAQPTDSPQRCNADDEEVDAPDTAPQLARSQAAHSASDELSDQDSDHYGGSHRMSPLAEEQPSPEHEPAEHQELKVGDVCRCSAKLEGFRLTIVKFGTAADFLNNGRVYVRYQALKKGCVAIPALARPLPNLTCKRLTCAITVFALQLHI